VAAWEVRRLWCAERSRETWKSDASTVAARVDAMSASAQSVGDWATVGGGGEETEVLLAEEVEAAQRGAAQ
jgi:hypothetical protein